MTLSTIGGTSRNRAVAVPNARPTHTPFRQIAASPGNASRPVQPGHTPHATATTGSTAALCPNASRLCQTRRYACSDSGRPIWWTIPRASTNTRQPSETRFASNPHTTSPTATCGRWSRTETPNRVP